MAPVVSGYQPPRLAEFPTTQLTNLFDKLSKQAVVFVHNIFQLIFYQFRTEYEGVTERIPCNGNMPGFLMWNMSFEISIQIILHIYVLFYSVKILDRM